MRRIEPTEHQSQAALVDWVKANAYRHPALAHFFAIPNGGLRSKAQAAKLKAEGVLKGIPDTCLPWPADGFHALWIEMKRKGETTSDDQDREIQYLRSVGYKVCVCFSVDEGIAAITRYLGL